MSYVAKSRVGYRIARIRQVSRLYPSMRHGRRSRTTSSTYRSSASGRISSAVNFDCDNRSSLPWLAQRKTAAPNVRAVDKVTETNKQAPDTNGTRSRRKIKWFSRAVSATSRRLELAARLDTFGE